VAVACGDSSEENPGLVTLSGTVRDYFSDAPISGADLAIEELPFATTAQANGTFRFTDIPAHSILTVSASAPNYRLTRNDTIQFPGRSVVHLIQAVAAADVARQFTILGLTETLGSAVVIATLVEGGVTLEGIPLTDITLRDLGMSPVGSGPYVVGATGDVDPALTAATAFGGRSRIVFLNVPPGFQRFELTLPGAPPRTLIRNVVTSTGGVALVTP
jgi:hypothetical protein